MNLGRTVFSQLIDFLPDREFRRCVARYNGDQRLRGLSCWEQYLAMAFAQLTYRESLRDIDVCLRSLGGKLYHMGFRGPVPRSTLADANEAHDWRIFADFAHCLIRTARPLYAHDPIGVDLDHSLYALDSTTIDLCLSLFPWAKFRRRKAAVKIHTLLDLHGNIPTFIRISEGKLHDVNVLDDIDPEAGSFYVLDRATSTSNACTGSRSASPSLWCAPRRSCNCSVATRTRSTGRPECSLTRPLFWPRRHRLRPIRIPSGAFAITAASPTNDLAS